MAAAAVGEPTLTPDAPLDPSQLTLPSEEETFRQQDRNFANVFAYFLRTYVSEPDDMDDPQNMNLNSYQLKLPYYVYLAKQYVEYQTERNHTFVVKMSHLTKWKPPEDTVSAGKQLHAYIRKYFLRIHEILEARLQFFIEELMEGTLREGKMDRFYLRLDELIDYVHSIRNLKCEKLGELIAVRGQVTRTSDVRPELRLASFKCNECHNVMHNVQQQFKYTTPPKCLSTNCTNLNDWELLMDSCSFGDWQKIRLQESASETGSGSMPRSIDVILRNDMIDTAHAGDRVIVTGCIIAVPDLPALLKPGDVPRSVARSLMQKTEVISTGITGIKGVGVRDLGHKICVLASSVETLFSGRKHKFEETEDDDSKLDPEIIFNDPDETIKSFCLIAQSVNTINILADSVAPRVYGHTDIKKGILLMMVGGVAKRTKNAKLRGDINMCIVGDPSTAKSQILKFVESLASRAVFASGKGSTAAGLTAAVRKDPTQGDYVIEAGALMYADQGICCIDEFDKMDEKDRTSIHEAMEQQTISISKAGIQATLNARTAVLAACNPKGGRYDTSKTFSQNVNIPAPLLSRFDLFYTMLDKAEETADKRISSHLLSLHEAGSETNRAADNDRTLDAASLQLYIEMAKRLKPILTDEAKDKLVDFYGVLRTNDTQAGARKSLRITARQLESLIRLSEAVARLKFSSRVTLQHAILACDVFNASLHRISSDREVILTDLADDVMDESRKPEDEMRISGIDYDSVVAILLDKVREEESKDATGMKSNELIEWYIDTVAQVTDVTEAIGWSAALQRIMHRMIIQENKLLSDPSDKPDVWHLRVHPNYSDIGNEARSNAYLAYGYKTFDAPVNGEADDDFDLSENAVFEATVGEYEASSSSQTQNLPSL